MSSYEEENGFFEEVTLQGQGVSTYQIIKSLVWYHPRSIVQRDTWFALNEQAEVDAIRLRQVLTEQEHEATWKVHAKIAQEKSRLVRKRLIQ